MLSYTVIGIELTSFFLTGVLNPGLASKTVDKVNNEEFDVEAGFCQDCNVAQTFDVDHCEYCDVCILGYDHHCPWIGKCVGQGNKRWFNIFICWTTGFLFYCLFILLFSG